MLTRPVRERHAHADGASGLDESLKPVRDTVLPRAVIRFAQRRPTGHDLEDGGWESGLASRTATRIRPLAERGRVRRW